MQTDSTRPYVSAVMHDVSPATWPDCRMLLDALASVAESVAAGPIRATLLVVPEFHRGAAARYDDGFMRLMDARLASGDELALHGYRHYDNAPFRNLRDRLTRGVYTAREGEFSALEYDDALERLRTGAEWFAANHWPLKGFVAPAWLLNEASWRALASLPLTYTTTLRRFYTLPDRRWIESHSLVYSARSAWRRTASRLVVDRLVRRLKNVPILRLGLHPIDAHYPEIVGHWKKIFSSALETRQTITKAGFADILTRSYRSQIEVMPIAAPTRAPASTSLG